MDGLMARGVPGSGHRMAPQPANPTGRLVITSVDGIKNGGVQRTHWCPKPEGEGARWACPDLGCGETFQFEGQSWRSSGPGRDAPDGL